MDPLFKKASADFDEGGAKGLLLNHLQVDSQGRIVFDSSDDNAIDIYTSEKAIDTREEEREGTRDCTTVKPELLKEHEHSRQEVDIDLQALCTAYFPDMRLIDSYDICPSLKTLDLGDTTKNLDIPFLKAPEHKPLERESETESLPTFEGKSGIYRDDENAAGFEDDDGLLLAFDTPGDTAFGEGGEAWARKAAFEPQMRVHTGQYEEGMKSNDPDNAGTSHVGGYDTIGNQYAVFLHHDKYDGEHEGILRYFDNALKKDWAGPEHWRIRRMKSSAKAIGSTIPRRKEKEPFEIDFTSPLDPALANLIYTPTISASTISTPKSQWKAKNKNLLPDDKHFNSRQLLQLFIKPRACISTRRAISDRSKGSAVPKQEAASGVDVNEAFWARQETAVPEIQAGADTPQATYDADFFQDDGLAVPGRALDNEEEEEDDDFADAQETLLLGENINDICDGSEAAKDLRNPSKELGDVFGDRLVAQSKRSRPEYVQYARVAKKVDVRRLKEEMWRGIGFEEVIYAFFLNLKG